MHLRSRPLIVFVDGFRGIQIIEGSVDYRVLVFSFCCLLSDLGIGEFKQ